MRSQSVLFGVACILGAAGVGAAAAASHGGGDTHLAAAAQILLAHGPAVLALGVAADAFHRTSRLLPAAAWALLAGASLFAADMAARRFLGRALFPMAAPAGGLILIGGWLLAAVALLKRPT